MLPFPKARRRHAMIERRTRDDASLALGERLYAGVTGVGPAVSDPIAIAVADTTPVEYAVLLSTDDVAAAFATGCMLDAFAEHKPPRNSMEARVYADEGWTLFRVLADQAGHVQHGLGADMSDAWPVLKTVQELQPDPQKMAQIAKLAGRMYEALRGAKDRRVQGIPEEVVGVETGVDFAALLPQEYAMLGTYPTRQHLYQEVLQRRALQFERQGTERKARGPLVILDDESGSMAEKPSRNIWAKAAFTALTRMAWEDKRPVVVVHFSTAVRVQVLKPGDKAGVVQAQHTFLDGGTDIGRAIRVGLEEVKNLATMGHRGADVVCISDGGDAGLGISFALDAMKKDNVRLFSVAIDLPFRGSLKDRAAEYVHLTDADMASDRGVLKIAGAVL